MRENGAAAPGGDRPAAAVFPRRLRLAGAAVHLYTASGSVLGLLIVLAAFDGDAVAALWLGLVALVIDGTDGMLARRMRVKETIPWFDGARLDDIVDYLTYAFAPVVLLWTIGALPGGWAGWVVAALPLLASAYQFCRVDAKTDDHTFLGFPSYWNVVAFYAIVLDLGPTAVAAVLVICSVLVFVPVRYLYPSRTPVLRGLSLASTAVWLGTYVVLLVQVPDPHPAVVALSLAYLAYYLLVSLWLTARAARRRRAERPEGLAAVG
ncbi:CDP-diacylglycerol O-phosphatidyltransferase [Geodermatophilus sp. DF01-2]|uniref:CDP-alcohol phosphatidyltransferase family protein n=1 Tax=Geodermatophilus sp. DF01-2 TaxID=2559610 RepID=UPI0010741707|nr:CDP-alcohol phosphatidyltransferase family protein [Geodermatophilus sp. DF01_2]TFV61753.1 CDP-diacylglycerol O-phosphatidyltransferase [Geodermatophilus sp. DF01_2]